MTTDNGVNVQALLDAREAVQGAPEAAQFKWRATSSWQNGVHSQVKIQNYFGLGAEQNHKDEKTFEADHPETFAASDNGITPIEYLLVGLTSCLTAGVANIAAARVRQVEVRRAKQQELVLAREETLEAKLALAAPNGVDARDAAALDGATALDRA